MNNAEATKTDKPAASASPIDRLVMRINSSNPKVTIDDVEYRWGGGFGSVLTSIEKGLKKGEVRMVGDQTMYVWKIETRGFRKPIVHWSFAVIDAEHLRSFKRAIFSA